MSRWIKSAAVVIAGACLVWGASNLHGQTGAQDSVQPAVAPVPVPAMAAQTVPAIGVVSGADALTLAPFDTSTGVIVPGTPAVTDGNVAAIPLPPSAYPGMVGLATAALAGWRYRRRRR
jgi:hypothetical protein